MTGRVTGPADGWPDARLDPLRRLRVLATALPGAAVDERVIDAPFAEVWGFLADLETSVPAFDRSVARVQVVRREGERQRIRVWGRYVPVPLAMDVVLRPGWGWMVSRPTLHVVGMAAEPVDDDRTRYAHLEATVVAGPRAVTATLGPALRLTRRYLRRHVARDQEGLLRCMAARRADGAG